MAKLQLARIAEYRRSFTEQDIADYVALGGQVPPDGEVPEPLLGAMFSRLLGTELPGLGTNYLRQRSDFKAPAFVGDTLIARVEITRLRPEKHLVDLQTTCRSSGGDLVCSGYALVYAKDVQQ